MIFELYYRTDHQINQKKDFLSKINGLYKNNIYKFINDNLYAECEILSYKNTIDKFFIVEININFEIIGLNYKESDEINLIKENFPNFIKIIEKKND